MTDNSNNKMFAGLTTGVKLEQYARSMLKQVMSMDDGSQRGDVMQERAHIGLEPMLLALAMEFALKAWFVWDHDSHDPIRTHDLAKLFDALPASSQKTLDAVFDKKVAPFHSQSWFMEYSIRDILEHHANAFVEWRYLHEKRDRGLSFDFSTFVATLELVLDEFRKRYETRKISPQRSHF